MSSVIPNPMGGLTFERYAAQLRAGLCSAETTTSAFFERISKLDQKLGAFTHLDIDRAMETARAMDRLLKAGTDLGPLMGIPVAVKDLYYVDGMPLNAGSKLIVSDIVKTEGTVVRALKRSGCIILGKTWTSEFALGGINFLQCVPWNPWDSNVHRTPGGSSGGSAVAQAAGMCAFALGTDTGGSVRMPAALCGVVGHKLTATACPLDGIFPLSPTLDSIGSFSSCMSDAVTIFTALTGVAVPEISIKGLRLGKPVGTFYQDLDKEIIAAIDQTLSRLATAGAEIISLEIPGLVEVESVFGRIVPVELIAILGVDRIKRNFDQLDPVSRSRFAAVLDLPAIDYVSASMHMTTLRRQISNRMDNCDCWVTPACPGLAIPLADIPDATAAATWNRRALRNTRPDNLFGQCGISLPLPRMSLPAGLQISCAPGDDAKVLGIARAIESVLGEPRVPNVECFAS